jgi:hypothetical protein
MTRSTRLRAVLSTAALAVVLAGCAMPRPVLPWALPTPVSDIAVDVHGCGTESMSFAVRPWEAHVRRGSPLRWTIPAGVDSMRIAPKSPGQWPFPGPPSVGRPNLPVQAGRVLGTAPIGHRYSYDVVLYCLGRIVTIDPDIIIRDVTD